MSALVRVFTPTLIVLCAVSGGCARYEYDLVQPTDVAQRIGRKMPVVVPIETVRYEARTYSDRLVLFIHNESEEPLKLLGEDSYAVDQRGESHPLPTRTVAPHSSTKLIFPPMRPTFRQSGPSIGFGLGVGVGSARRRGYHGAGRYGYFGDPFYQDAFPRYYQLADDGTIYWNWTGNNTEVTVRFVYQLADERFHHEFVFRRIKV